ncbi:hypothetical protein I4U23_029974 [Adineta vaga]|nr:hypothetical protein I4U23_029974 [Adineta vaga]
MIPSIVLFIFITSISLLECRNQSITSNKTSRCVNDTYVIPLFSTRIIHIQLNRTHLQRLNIHTVHISSWINDRKVASFYNDHHRIDDVLHISNNTKIVSKNESILIYNLQIHANYINRTTINYSIQMINTKNRIYRIKCSIVVIVNQPRRLIDKIFKGLIPFIIMFISIQMGVLLDIEVLKELIRRPIQVCIGFVCQYGLMPLIAFGITKIFHYEPLYGLGLFVVGCCPGGWASNQWTVLFDGDLNLSAFMSFASTVASFFMLPFWLYTLGERAYLNELKIHIPFLNLAQTLLTVIGPLALGMLLVYCIPKLKPIVTRIFKPMLLILMIYFFVFGAFVNYYLFRYLDLRTALSAPLLPWQAFY